MPKATSTPCCIAVPLLPVSPPAPHRRAPHPPTWRPRRPRSRHVRMREPARVGLFTVAEADEDAIFATAFAAGPSLSAAAATCRLSASSSLSTRIDFSRPMSWASDAESCPTATDGGSDWEAEPATPNLEREDPFALDSVWSDSDDSDSAAAAEALEQAIAALGASIKAGAGRAGPPRPKRPPPLDLSAFRDVPAVVSPGPCTPTGRSPCTPALALATLLPALPITGPVRRKRSQHRAVSPGTPTLRTSRAARRASMSPASPRSPLSPTVDLSSALHDLLVSCGEDDALAGLAAESDDELPLPPLSFPLPPSRATPPSPSSPATPATPWSAEIRTPGAVDVFGPVIPIMPRTPDRGRYAAGVAATPASPYTACRREPITPRLIGDHSFLQSLSSPACSGGSGDASRVPSPASSMSSLAYSTASASGSSGSSRSSGRALPRRAALPTAWMYGQPV